MLILRSQLFCTLSTLLCAIWCRQAIAEILTTPDDSAINNLYENLLQREYAGPVVFPNHRFERKAQRSPSLRLRFGRRSVQPALENGIPHSVEKRWSGDVDQKPIRSPSLRLRFGRRNDPSVPLHDNYVDLVNNLAASEENSAPLDYNDYYGFEGYERAVRKPQRLRWGRRDMPYESAIENSYMDENEQRTRSDDYLNSLLNSQKLRNMLLALHQLDAETAAALSPDDAVDAAEFEREARKPNQPLRLRWGRSTGGRSSYALAAGVDKGAQQKKSLSANAMNGEKSQQELETQKSDIKK